MKAYFSLSGHYDALTEDVPYSEFADFYEAIFQEYGLKPKSIIDLACGTGSMSYELASRGYDMIAVDQSPDMLSVAMEKLGEFSPMPLLICQPLEELDLYGTSDAAVCTLDGMNYLDPEQLRRAFHRIRFFLEPGGLLIFDINSPHKLRSLDGQIFLDETEDCFCVWRAELDKGLNACFYGMDIFERCGKGWQRSKEEHLEYIHEVDFLKQILTENNYCDIRVFGDRKLSDPAEDELRLFLSARKPK